MSLLSYTGGQQLVMLPDSLNGDEKQERTHLFCALSFPDRGIRWRTGPTPVRHHLFFGQYLISGYPF